ncbi:transcription termination/antitermination protein NusA [Marinicella pacifica]|uniref:Transcription termination/antitermination protein NusA n=1 Tax=Marinicella pacifica TaxID=1171543 RepID=A0A917CN44_9GAMM|nr:transcription termination factor NusA [Marinicella pacifica]GGF93171.1 transcription termination/antitermination protein NusA [Marinicella pacifica]
MSKEILYVVDSVSNEKDVDRSVIFGALEAALAMATRKDHDEDIDVRVAINRDTGEYDSFRVWTVVEADELEEPAREITLEEAHKTDPNLQIGDTIEEELESVSFGRISAQTAKQVIIQKVREAERAKVVDMYEDRIGEVLSGIVKRVERGHVFIDVGAGVEAIVPREHAIPRENIKNGDRLKGLLIEVNTLNRGPILTLSRRDPKFMIELFKIEVPEISQGFLEIKGAARDPGQRAKIAVFSHDKKLDPIGACVGMRGSRVMSVANELGGERIDIVLWDENPAQFIINAMAPAEIESIVVDEEKNTIDVAVDESQLSQAIGRGGQNVRLASELTGWEINVLTTGEAEEKNEAEAMAYVKEFEEKLDVDEDLAVLLVQEGFTSIEEIAYVDRSELLAIDGFDEDLVDELRGRSRDALLTQLIAKEEQLEDNKPSQDLLDLALVDDKLAYRLADKGIRTRDDLADLATDELMALIDMDESAASELIMQAREHWFE